MTGLLVLGLALSAFSLVVNAVLRWSAPPPKPPPMRPPCENPRCYCSTRREP